MRLADSSAGAVETAGDADMIRRTGQAEARHVGVDGFELAGAHDVGFVPDANGAVCSDAAIELRPGRKMMRIARMGIGMQVLKAAPILKNADAPPIPTSQPATA